MDSIKIGPTLTALFDRDQAYLFELAEPTAHTALTVAHVLRKTVLARKALVQFASVFEQHSVDQLGTDRYFFAFENEIGHARPAALRGDVRPFEAQVTVLESVDFPQALHTCLSLEI